MICPHCGKETDPAPLFVKFPMMVYKAINTDGKTILDSKRAESQAMADLYAEEGYVEGPENAMSGDAPKAKTPPKADPEPVKKSKGAHS